MRKIIFIILILFSLISFISAHTGNDEFDHCSGFCPMLSGNHGSGWMVFGWLTNLLIVIVLGLFIVWLIKKIKEKNGK